MNIEIYTFVIVNCDVDCKLIIDIKTYVSKDGRSGNVWLIMDI